MKNGKYISVPEASLLAGISEGNLYRHIRKGSIPYQTVSDRGRTLKKVSERDIVRFFNLSGQTLSDAIRTQSDTCQTVSDAIRQASDTSPALIRDTIKEVISEYFQDRETQLMKPMEEQAIFIAGELKNEIKHLQAEKEALRIENENLKKEMKALPDLQQVETLQKKKEEQENKLLEKSENIRILQKEKEVITDLREQTEEEKKKLVTRLEEKQKEKEEQQEIHKAEKKNYLATIEELKKRLEEEEKRPWWRKIFG